MTSERRRRTTKLWGIDKARGVSHAPVDAGPARDHIRAFRAEGWTYNSIGRAAGMSGQGIAWIDEEQSPRVLRSTARRVLAVTRRDLYDSAGDHDWVPSIGVIRRAHALCVIGYPVRALIETHGLMVKPRNRWTTAKAWRAMRDFYDTHWETPGPSRHCVTRSRARGWAPPLAWDDDTIDDPGAHPHQWIELTSKGRSLKTRRPGEFLEDAEFLIGAGENLAGIARRMGMDAESVTDMLKRNRRPDLVARLKLTDEWEAS